MKKINTLHLASFEGNIGDNANHNGFYSSLKIMQDMDFEFTTLEIREFYWKQRFFNQEFVDYTNKFDLLIIGGGNYFELWVEHSPTGTSIMIEPELFKKIKIPVIFNALGVDPGQGATSDCCLKFKKFLDVIFLDKKNFVSVRNDGALEAIKQYIGEEYVEKFHWTPDAGINVSCDNYLLCEGKDYLAINIAGDMLDVRFPNNNEMIDYNTFIKQFADVLIQIFEEDCIQEIVLIPHIYKDMKCINDLLDCLPDSVIRQQVSIAPLLHGKGAEEKLFSIYKNAKATLAMRFHANLCSIGLGVPTIGLINYRQIDRLYSELGLTDYSVNVNQQGFQEELYQKLMNALNSGNVRKKFIAASAKQKSLYGEYINKLEIFLRNYFR